MNQNTKNNIWFILFGLISTLIVFLQQIKFSSIIFPIFLRVIVPLVTIYFGYKAIKFFGISSTQGKSILLMTIALSISLLGNIFWIMGTEKMNFIAKLSYIVMRPFFAFGIFYSVFIIDSSFLKFDKFIAILSTVVIFGVAYFIIMTYNVSEHVFLENIFRYSYFFLDYFLLIFAAVSMYFAYIYFTGKYCQYWIFLCLGSIMFWVSEINYFFNYDNAIHPIIELGWVYGSLFFAKGFANLKLNAEKTLEKLKTS